MNRRTFLGKMSAALGSCTVGSSVSFSGVGTTPEVSAGPEDHTPRADDYQAPAWLRYARALNFEGYTPPVWPSLKDFDARRLVEGVREIEGDTLRFAAIAYCAYYPSKVFPVHPEIGNRDLIDEVSRECRRVGVHLYCYTGYWAPFMPVGWVDAHPKYVDWVLRGPDGKPYGTYPHTGWMLLQRLCTTGDAYREAIRTVVRELCERDIEGVYFDGPSGFGYGGICFCDSCRRNFKTFSGMDIERLNQFVKGRNGLSSELSEVPSDTDIEALAAWYDWANQLIKEDLLDFRQTIHGSGKFMLCHNGPTWRNTSLPLQYRVPDGFMEEASEQIYQRLVTGMRGAAMARPYRKLTQIYMGSYQLSWFGQPRHSHPRAIYNANLEDTDEVRMEGFTDLASGNAPIYSTANRLFYGLGSGSAEPAKEVFELMRHLESIHKDSVPVPYVAIVPTWGSLQLWRTKRHSWNRELSEALGLALLDERISFDVNPSTEMSEEWLKGQQVIALCGASGIADAEAERLAAWVKQGGGLLATYDIGLYDEKGQLRQDGGALKEVLGVQMKSEPFDSQPECYYRIKKTHPALRDFGPGTMIYGDGQLVPVEVLEGATVLADAWNIGTKESRGPSIIANQYAKGRSIYVSAGLEGHYPSSRVVSIRRLFGSIVRYLAGEAPLPFRLSAPMGVYGVLRRATNRDLVLWVLGNVGFKDADIGQMRQEFVPISNVEVGILVPEERQVKSVRLERARQNVPFRLEGGYVVATIPKLHIAEVVHLELA